MDSGEAEERKDCSKHRTALLDIEQNMVCVWLHALCKICQEIWTSQQIQNYNQQNQTWECLGLEENWMVLFMFEFVAREDHGSDVSSIIDHCLETNWPLVTFVGDLLRLLQIA